MTIQPPPWMIPEDPPFRHQWTQHTRDGVVCYFCRTVVERGSRAPCCLAAQEWAAEVMHANRMWIARLLSGGLQ